MSIPIKLPFLTSLLLVSAYTALAQSSATLASVGYATPVPIPVAPGQVVTMFFREIGPLRDGSLRSAEAKTVPLPIVLGGLSLTIGRQPTNVPIFAVRQENDCFEGQITPACLLTAIRIQVPYNLQPDNQLTLVVDGQASRNFRLAQTGDNAHVLTSCDLNWDTNWASSCSRLSFHADGTAITEKSPARPGESIVIYLWGLGLTSPGVSSGGPSPPGVVVTQFPGIPAVRVRLLDGPRTSLTATPASYSAEDSVDPGLPVEYLGLTPGQIGLYQINVTIPRGFTSTTLCGQPVAGAPLTIAANAVLHVSTPYAGTQELGFCWKP